MIPEWNMAGVLPPVSPGLPGAHPNRSPYETDLDHVIDQFATSPDRIKMLKGLLDFRLELSKVGITKGFQWLDESFLENVEDLESRSPRDIDVVTFYYLPEGETQQSLLIKQPALFQSSNTKD